MTDVTPGFDNFFFYYFLFKINICFSSVRARKYFMKTCVICVMCHRLRRRVFWYSLISSPVRLTTMKPRQVHVRTRLNPRSTKALPTLTALSFWLMPLLMICKARATDMNSPCSWSKGLRKNRSTSSCSRWGAFVLRRCSGASRSYYH